MGGQFIREQNLKRSNTTCTSPIHTRVTDSPPAGPSGHTWPPTLTLHANTMLAAPPRPGRPASPLPTHSPSASSRRPHPPSPVPSPMKERGAMDSKLRPGNRVGWATQNSLSPFSQIKMRVLELSWFLFFIFPFSSILACLLRKGILKKRKRQKNVKKKKATPTPVSVYSLLDCQPLLCSVV